MPNNDGIVTQSVDNVLRELSGVVGRDVADVRRASLMKFSSGVRGVHQPSVWVLMYPDGARSLSFASDDLRREERLNEVALTHWRRPAERPRLTGKDGRRLIRLLHEVIEARQREFIAAQRTSATVKENER